MAEFTYEIVEEIAVLSENDKDKITALSARQEAYWNRIANANFLSDNEKKELLDF